MVATKTRMDTKLVVVLDTGDMKNGKAVTRNFTFSKVKDTATDDQLLSAGTALGSLCAEDLDSVKVNEIYNLTTGA